MPDIDYLGRGGAGDVRDRVGVLEAALASPEVEFIAPADGVQSIATTAARANLFWNGQRLASSAFTLSGGILQTSASLPVVAGDQLIIEPK